MVGGGWWVVGGGREGGEARRWISRNDSGGIFVVAGSKSLLNPSHLPPTSLPPPLPSHRVVFVIFPSAC